MHQKFTFLISLLFLTTCADPLNVSNVPNLCITPYNKPSVDPKYKTILANRFDEMNNSWNNGMGYSEEFNYDGRLAWAESYILQGYMEMFRATNNTKYLDFLISHAQNIFEHRDDQVGNVDYNGKIRKTWIANGYSSIPMAWVVHSGMILFPITDFAQTILNNKSLNSYQPIALDYIQKIQETLDEHEENWDDHDETYRFPTDAAFLVDNGRVFAGDVLPFNQQNAMGRVFLMMYLATKDNKYKVRAEKIAGFFKSGLMVFNDNHYIWNYWKSNNNLEDYSHATIDISFVYLMYKNCLVFNKENLQMLTNTFKYMNRTNGNLSSKVDGSGEISQVNTNDIIGLYLSLHNIDVFNNIWGRFLNNLDGDKIKSSGFLGITSGPPMLSVAYLLNYLE